MNVGTEWLVDAEGCSAELLRDAEAIRRVCDEVIGELDLGVVGDPQRHKFPPPGSGVYFVRYDLLATKHPRYDATLAD